MAAIARRLGGPSLNAFFPASLAHLAGRDLELTLYPHGVTLYGTPRSTARAHALIAEAALRMRALQTSTPRAQRIERRIQKLAHGLGRSARGSTRAAGLSDRVLREIASAELDFDDWEILYRMALQLGAHGRGSTAEPVKKAVRSGA
jgi:hypothetical protein